MNLINILQKLRDDIKSWVTTNLIVLNEKIEQNTVVVDTQLDADSENPIQNKTVVEVYKTFLDNQNDYRQLLNTLDITDNCSNDITISDGNGNIIAKIDSNGIWTTQIILIDTNTNLPYKISVQNGNLIVNQI